LWRALQEEALGLQETMETVVFLAKLGARKLSDLLAFARNDQI